MAYDFSIPREKVPEPEAGVIFHTIGPDRAAWRIIPGNAHYDERWHYDAATGDLISYAGCYQTWRSLDPKYAGRKFPDSIPLQRVPQ